MPLVVLPDNLGRMATARDRLDRGRAYVNADEDGFTRHIRDCIAMH